MDQVASTSQRVADKSLPVKYCTDIHVNMLYRYGQEEEEEEEERPKRIPGGAGWSKKKHAPFRHVSFFALE